MQFIEQGLRCVERQQLADTAARGDMVLECTKTCQQCGHVRATTHSASEESGNPCAINRRVELLEVQLYERDSADVNLRIRNVRTSSNARVEVVRLLDSLKKIEEAAVDSLQNNLRNFDLTAFLTLLYREDTEVAFIGREALEERQVDIEDILCQPLAACDLVQGALVERIGLAGGQTCSSDGVFGRHPVQHLDDLAGNRRAHFLAGATFNLLSKE